MVRLRQQMVNVFSLEDIRTLCFDLGVNFDELPRPGLTPKVRDLIALMKQTDRLEALLASITRARPGVDWPELANLEMDIGPESDFISPANAPTSVLAHGRGASAVGPRGVYVEGDVGGDIITGDVYNYYIQGTRLYMPEFTTSVENFFYHYLGDEENPVPFGGRDEALRELEAWRRQKETPPRLLLTAPAGRGKSALLVRWSVSLQAVSDFAVVFIPISIRFNTNEERATFSLLATRLAHLYGKEIPADWSNYPAASWRRLVAEYLQSPLPGGRQLLLIVDGLDEAAWQPGADLFPHQLPQRVRLVVSARYKGGEEQGPGPWLRQLGWDRFSQMAATMELETLTVTGVRDVLEKMDCPLDELGRNVDIVAELHHLSEGDPLLVELYVRDLWQQGEAVARLQPEDLHAIQPGYKGYFEKWWTDQEVLWGPDDPLTRELENDVLDALAMALGPLTLTDLHRLLPGQVRGRRLKRAIRPLSRFVIGDGEEQGYAFAHPKLGEYFREDLLPDEQAAWQARFLDWGERTVADLVAAQMRPYDVSRYLMSYYGRHLEETATGVESLLPLVSWEWLQVWHKKTLTYGGFLQDVDRVWAQLRSANEAAARQEQAAPYIDREILCALCHASVNSLVAHIPNERLILLLKHKLWTEEQALAYVRQKRDIRERAEAFSLLSTYLSEKTRKFAWQELLAAAQEMDDRDGQGKVLAAAAPYLPQEVLAMAWEIERVWSRADVLHAVLPHLPREARPAVAREVLVAAEGIVEEWNQALVLEAVAPYLPQEVLAVAQGMRDGQSRARLLKDIVPYLPQEALKAGQKIDDEGALASLLWVTAPHLPKESLVVARGIDNDWMRADALLAIATHLPAKRRTAVWAEALAAAQKIEQEWNRVAVLVDIAPHLPLEVLAATEKLDFAESRVDVMVAVAPHLQAEMRTAVLKEALGLAWQNGSMATPVRKLVAIAPYMPREVLTLVEEIKDERNRKEVLEALAPQLPEEVLGAAQQIDDRKYRVDVMVAAADHLSQERKTAVLEEALAIAWKENTETGQSEAFEKLVPHLPPEMRTRELAEALVVREIGDIWYRASVLEAMAPQLPEEALAIARQLGDERERAKILATVAPHLPQERRTAVLEEALAIAREMIYDEHSRVEILETIAPYMPQEVLAAAQEIGRGWKRAAVLVAVALHLPREVLAAAGEIDDEESRAKVLKAVAPHLPEEVLAAAREISDEWSRAEVLLAVTSYLPSKKRAAIVEEALATAQQIRGKGSRMGMLAIIAPHLGPEKCKTALEEVLAAMSRLNDKWSRMGILLDVAPYLPLKALAAAREVEDDIGLVELLDMVAHHVPQEALEAARQVKEGWRRAEALSAVLPSLPIKMQAAVFEEVLTIVREMNDMGNRVQAMERVIPSLPEKMRVVLIEEVLAVARGIDDDLSRAIMLNILSEQQHIFLSAHLYKLWRETLPVLSRRTRPQLLSDIKALLPVIQQLGGHTAVRSTWQAIQTASNWWS